MYRPSTLALLAMLAACDKSGVTVDYRHHKPEGGKAVASWASDSITDVELQARFAEMTPYQRARYQTLEQKKEYVDGQVRFELLVQEALKRGLHNHPDVVETAKKVMVQRLMQDEMDTKRFPVADAAINAWYEQHKGDFVKPAMTRLAHVFFKPENKEKATGTLKEALALAQLDYAGFAKLARERSEDPRTQPVEGDMRFLSDDELTAQYGAELVAAQNELTQVGQVLPRLVETKAGFHVVRLQGRQIALNLTVDKVKDQIQSTLANEMKQQHYAQFLEQLKKNAGYKVDDAALGAIQIDVKAAGVEPKGPIPGFAPPPEEKRPDR